MECVVCKGKKINEIYGDYLECHNCGLIWVKNMPLKSDLISRYVSGQISPIEYYKQTQEEDRRTFRKRLELIQKFCKGKDILDVGCNIGTLLEVADEMGFNARGIDINFMCREYGKLKGLKIDHSVSDELPYKVPFDIIVMNDVIEHVLDPISFLKEAKKHLKREGIIFISTPDTRSLSKKILKNKWYHLKPEEHIYYFNKNNFNKLAVIAGLKVIYSCKLARYRKIKTFLLIMKRYLGCIVNIIPFKDRIIPINFGDEICLILTHK